MLCQFRFKNFKSYYRETVLDMQAAKIEEFTDSLIVPKDAKFSPLLPLAVLYGPNAGGKSCMIDALSYLISRVLIPVQTSTGRIVPSAFGMYLTGMQPFLFDEHSRDEPTEFELFFRTGKAQYHYQLALTKDAIKSECLSFVKCPCRRRRCVTLFERKDDKILPGSLIHRAKTQNVSSTIPFLSFLATNYDFPEIEDVISWFYNCCIVDYAVPDSDHKFYALLNDPVIKPAVLNLLSEMDIPICDYESLEETGDNNEKSYRVLTTHMVEGRSYRLDLRNESEGTRKILSVILPMLISQAGGGLFIADELDAKLHPQLLRYLVKRYSNPTINARQAQIIFTCHDLSIMKNDLLRRDEIWFTARGEDSGSELWSLYDLCDEKGERVKNTAAYDKQYLEGRYGADPYLKRMLDWRVVNAQKTETP